MKISLFLLLVALPAIGNDFQHAVNRKQDLQAFLKSSTRIAEGDVSLVDKKLVMFHPPMQGKVMQKSVDLAFKEWFVTVIRAGRGVKLDIKGDAKTSDLVIAEIKSLFEKGTLPTDAFKRTFVIANADLVKGPGGNAPEITATEMANWRKSFPDIRISVGFTDENNDKGVAELYSNEMVKEMIATLASVGGGLDLNLRGKRISDSRNQPIIKSLLESIPKEIRKDLSITVWNWKKYGDVATEADKTYFKSLLPENPSNVLFDL